MLDKTCPLGAGVRGLLGGGLADAMYHGWTNGAARPNMSNGWFVRRVEKLHGAGCHACWFCFGAVVAIARVRAPSDVKAAIK